MRLAIFNITVGLFFGMVANALQISVLLDGVDRLAWLLLAIIAEFLAAVILIVTGIRKMILHLIRDNRSINDIRFG